MAAKSSTMALLALDFQLGIADGAFAASAVEWAVAAVGASRRAGMATIFSKLTFEPGGRDVAPQNPFFDAAGRKASFTGEGSRLVPQVVPMAGEVVVEKRRFSAFRGSELDVVIRSQGITDLVLCGVSTGGVVLATFMEASDHDYTLTVLSDACADPNAPLHHELVVNLFPRSARVLRVGDWIDAL